MFAIPVHVVVAQNMMTRSVKPIPDLQKTLILRNRDAEVSQLNHKIGFQLVHSVDKNTQSFIRVVHDVFVDIGHHTKSHGTILIDDLLRPSQARELRYHEHGRAACRSATSQESSAGVDGFLHDLF